MMVMMMMVMMVDVLLLHPLVLLDVHLVNLCGELAILLALFDLLLLLLLFISFRLVLPVLNETA